MSFSTRAAAVVATTAIALKLDRRADPNCGQMLRATPMNTLRFALADRTVGRVVVITQRNQPRA